MPSIYSHFRDFCRFMPLYAILLVQLTTGVAGQSPPADSTPRVSVGGPVLLSFDHPKQDYLFLSSALRYQDFSRQISNPKDAELIQREVNILPRVRASCGLSGGEDWSSDFQEGKSKTVFCFASSSKTFSKAASCTNKLLIRNPNLFDNLIFDVEGKERQATISRFMTDSKRGKAKDIWRNSVRVGNYGMMPSSTSRWSSYPPSQNTKDNTDFYNRVGLRIAMPVLYGYSDLSRHGSPGSNFPKGERSPGYGKASFRAGMFWAQLEHLTAVKERLPTNHLLIPWTCLHFKQAGNNRAPIPTRATSFALLKHVRLRGADGLIAFVPFGVSPSFKEKDPAIHGDEINDYQSDFSQSWLANFDLERASSEYTEGDYIFDCRNAWSCLDELYGPEIQTHLHFDGTRLHGPFGPETKNQRDLNNYEEKSSGFHVSGLRYVNTVYFIASNFSNEAKPLQIPSLPEVREDTPQRLYDFEPEQVLAEVPKLFIDSSTKDPYPTDSNHVEYVHRITNLLKNAGFENGDDGWVLLGGAKIISGDGVDGSNGVSFRTGVGPVATIANAADAEPGVRMKIHFSAKGENCKLSTLLYYDDGVGLRSQKVRWSDGSFFRDVTGEQYSSYSAEFRVNKDFVANLRPRFFLKPINEGEVKEVSIDNVVIKFSDSNLLSNGDFDANSDGWALSSPKGYRGSVGVYGSSALIFESEGLTSAVATGMNRISVSDFSKLRLRFAGKGKGSIGLQFEFFDDAGSAMSKRVVRSKPLLENFARYTVFQAVPENAVSCRIGILKLPDSGIGESTVDDVELFGE